MTSLEKILFDLSWIPYNNHFSQSRIILTYPENVIFTAQFMKHVSSLDVYNRYPYAEKINVSHFAPIRWEKTIIAFDRDLQLIFAPDPVQQLIRLERRLQYKEAADKLFGPFRFFPSFEVFNYQWLGILWILFFCSMNWLFAKRYKGYSLALSSNALTSPKQPDP